jgi:urea transport system permease protein
MTDAQETTSAGPALDPAVRTLRLVMTLLVLGLFFILIPALSAAGLVADHNLNRLGRYLCFSIAAVGIGLAWGYTGILSLCQAFFFCLGGYAMAMHLALPEGGGDVREDYNNLPQFLFFANPDSKELPFFWKPFSSPVFALALAVLAPAMVASLLGFFIFRNRVKGVYFSIITQAIAWGAFLAFCRNEMLVGGTNGLTNFYKPLNLEHHWILALYILSCVVLLLVYLVARHITRTRLGRLLVAVRDNESRLLFAGFRPDRLKVFAFTFAAIVAAIGGVLYAPQTGIITPNIMKVEDSIWMVVWVAMGGRGKLWGAVIGALVMLYSQSLLTSSLPTLWLFVQGGLAVAVVLLVPDGLVGVWERLEQTIERRAGVGRVVLAATPFAALVVFIFFEGLGLMPEALTKVVLGLQISYWLLIAAMAGGGAAQSALRLSDSRRSALRADDVSASSVLASKGAEA